MSLPQTNEKIQAQSSLSHLSLTHASIHVDAHTHTGKSTFVIRESIAHTEAMHDILLGLHTVEMYSLFCMGQSKKMTFMPNKFTVATMMLL